MVVVPVSNLVSQGLLVVVDFNIAVSGAQRFALRSTAIPAHKMIAKICVALGLSSAVYVSRVYSILISMYSIIFGRASQLNSCPRLTSCDGFKLELEN